MGTLNASQRKEKETGKKYARKIRREGEVPAVIYGDNKPPLNIFVNPVVYKKLLVRSEYKKNMLFDIIIDENTTERVITKQVEVNPINNEFIHIDFLRISEKNSIQVDVPIRIDGISAGQRLGGVLVIQKRTVTVEALPDSIPVDIKVDITALSIGGNIRAEDLIIDHDVALISNKKDILVKVESTKASKVADDAAIQGVASNVSGDATADSNESESE